MPVYESIEWDNTWLEQSGNTSARRILYVGDSITVGTRGVANHLGGGKVVFDHFGTSKALDNPYFFDSLRLFAAQQPCRAAVFFNNGLHGWHLTEEEYERLYADMLDRLLQEFPDVPVVPMLTTCSETHWHPNDRVLARNEAVRRIAEARGLPVIDLYTVADANREHLADGVHFHPQGYRALAEELMRAVDRFCPVAEVE